MNRQEVGIKKKKKKEYTEGQLREPPFAIYCFVGSMRHEVNQV